jgi:hypothetical protein
MTPRTKRTYNLSPDSVRRVRELSADYGVADSQDAVLELAIERLYGDVVAEREANMWASAAADPEFRSELTQLEQEFNDRHTWPR